MSSKELEKHYKALLDVEKTSTQIEVNMKKSIHLLKEEMAMHLQYRKKNGGDLDLAKISKAVLMLALELFYKLKKDNKLEENIEKFEIYTKAIKDKSINLEEAERLFENKKLKDELKPTKKELLEKVKDDLGEEDALALEQLISIIINNEKEIVEEKMNKELGIEKNIKPKTNKGVLYERVKQIAEELNININ